MPTLSNSSSRISLEEFSGQTRRDDKTRNAYFCFSPLVASNIIITISAVRATAMTCRPRPLPVKIPDKENVSSIPENDDLHLEQLLRWYRANPTVESRSPYRWLLHSGQTRTSAPLYWRVKENKASSLVFQSFNRGIYFDHTRNTGESGEFVGGRCRFSSGHCAQQSTFADGWKSDQSDTCIARLDDIETFTLQKNDPSRWEEHLCYRTLPAPLLASPSIRAWRNFANLALSKPKWYSVAKEREDFLPSTVNWTLVQCCTLILLCSGYFLFDIGNFFKYTHAFSLLDNVSETIKVFGFGRKGNRAFENFLSRFWLVERPAIGQFFLVDLFISLSLSHQMNMILLFCCRPSSLFSFRVFVDNSSMTNLSIQWLCSSSFFYGQVRRRKEEACFWLANMTNALAHTRSVRAYSHNTLHPRLRSFQSSPSYSLVRSFVSNALIWKYK